MTGVTASSSALSKNLILFTPSFYLLIPLLFFVLWFVYWRISHRHMIKLANEIPGEDGLPLIGSAWEFIGKSPPVIFSELMKRSKDYNVGKMWFGPKLVIMLTDPRDVELVLNSSVHIDKSDEYSFFKPWLGDGLLISTGQKWQAHRKLIAPTFHLNVLKSFIDLFNTNSKAVVQRLRREKGKIFDIHDYMGEATVEILLETVMGVDKKKQLKSGFKYAMAVMEMCDILHMRHTKFWLRSEWLFNLTSYGKKQIELLKTIHTFTLNAIKIKKEKKTKSFKTSPVLLKKTSEPEKSESETSVEGVSFGQAAGLKDDLDVIENDVGEKTRMAFLDLLLEAEQAGTLISQTEIKEQVDTIMFEGHDTTAAASSFFITMMGCYPEIQNKVIEELDGIFGDSDRPATFADTLEMKYLERTIMETLRLFPPVPIIARKINEDIKLVSCDATVPAGATVIIGTIKIHRDPTAYANPNDFNPDHFLSQQTANRHYYAFIPFSAGPRSCVGRKYAMLKLKILLSTVMRNFRFYSDIKREDFQLQADIILKRHEGFPVRLEARKHTVK